MRVTPAQKLMFCLATCWLTLIVVTGIYKTHHQMVVPLLIFASLVLISTFAHLAWDRYAWHYSTCKVPSSSFAGAHHIYHIRSRKNHWQIKYAGTCGDQCWHDPSPEDREEVEKDPFNL